MRFPGRTAAPPEGGARASAPAVSYAPWTADSVLWLRVRLRSLPRWKIVLICGRGDAN
jgi:hypothetical protein